MRFVPLGGGKEIGANSYLLQVDGKNILIDCGRHPIKEGYESLPAIDEIDKLDYVFISHSHYDHLSSLPHLVKFFPNVRVLTSRENKKLSVRILRNSVEVMKKKNEKDGEPILYNHSDVKKAKKRMIGVEYYEPFKISKKLFVTFYPAGHVMGASSILLEYKGKKIFYTGDISLSDQLTIPSAVLPDKVDVLISEGTYGLKEEATDTRHSEIRRLELSIKKVLKNKGRVLLPVFALGRGQEVLYMILKMLDEEKIPDVPVYTNGMVSIITNLYLQEYAGMPPEKKKWFNNAILRRVRTVPKNYKTLLYDKRPMILILSSGMLIEDTLSYLFAKEILQDNLSAIFFMGYQSPESIGYSILEAARSREEEISYGEERIQLRCTVKKFNFSGHASYEELISLPRELQPSKLVYVHGDEEALLNLSKELEYEFDISVPSNLETVLL
ncbi:MULTISPECIES: MBL fold metallo-hydrolase [Kosmotoga]|uniref:Beta-lactamase domain protein n=1 Tax=Kosmotoga olearia (strain ATCC BAA-1733 / DSM 21960 / TBF 19.5.1) TaxID=521045 RepID=C5CE02_KOSOT|nr:MULTISPECIES: MBL fold metallo-hydrolase [Kosmotoga]ACR80104.1 beta-lactamase domain protein [Kosmotoga olearia TBF 19.5.1]OAA20451.1 beta-lactamase [Kosmotoga sp. DU53]